MKTLKLILVLITASFTIVSCTDKQTEIAQSKVDEYAAYIDSVSEVTAQEAAKHWETIEANYQEMKTDVSNSMASIEESSGLQMVMDEATLKYEAYKARVIAEHERMEAEKERMRIREALLGTQHAHDDMQLTWINKDNILSVYQNFVSTVENNKDSYSREDWDEIKLLYEAIDTRKNTVEKQGLSSADNKKIAALKLKFAPMYTINRMGAKSEENAQAKK